MDFVIWQLGNLAIEEIAQIPELEITKSPDYKITK